jgi:predicted dehydrogenase
MKEVCWGIIGCGDVTEVKSGPALQKAEGSRLVAVMRRDAARAEDYARRHGVPRWYSDADELIRDPEVNAVYIATPPAFHKPYTLACAKAGKPVYVEKPMALNHAECEEMIEACRRAGVPLFVAFYRRALPRFAIVRRLLDEGAIGKVRYVTTVQTQPAEPERYPAGGLPWRVQPEIAGGGLFIDLASHTIDLLDDLLGPVDRVCGLAANRAGLYPAEDWVGGTYTFASGAVGTGLWSFCAQERTDRNEIVGSRGSISFSTFGDGPIRLTADGRTEEFPADNPEHIQQPLIQTVVDELLGRGTCPSTGTSAARTSRVLDAMIANYYGSGEASR